MGGRNPTIGIVYVTMGAILCLIGLFMAVKNRKAPR